MAQLVFDNFKGMIQGADDGLHASMKKGLPGQFSNSIIAPNRLIGCLFPFPIGVSLTNFN